MRPQSVTRNVGLKLLIGCCLFVCGCAEGSEQPTPETAKRFLKLRGYDFNEKSFFAAAARSDLIAVNGYLSAGINPNAKDENGDTALTSAAARGDSKIVTALLASRADVNVNGRNGWTALLLALDGERDEVTDLLFAQPNIDLKAETPNGMDALMLAVWHQRPAMVRKLLDRGVDVNHQDKDGDTAVHGAAFYDNADILHILLTRGANPNVKNKLGGTALMWAASYGHDEIVRALLDKGADSRLKDVDGVSAADWAAKNGQGNIAMLLHEAEKSGGRRQ
jgi:ankyrin repeat protein